MPDEKPKRPWWKTTRALGVGIFVAGIGMLFIPATQPVAIKAIEAGLTVIVSGFYAAKVRGESLTGK